MTKSCSIIAFVGAVFWNFCALKCLGADVPEPDTMATLVTLGCLGAIAFSVGLGLWLRGVPVKIPAWLLACAIVAVTLGPGIVLVQPFTSIELLRRSALEGAGVTLLGVAFIGLRLRHIHNPLVMSSDH